MSQVPCLSKFSIFVTSLSAICGKNNKSLQFFKKLEKPINNLKEVSRVVLFLAKEVKLKQKNFSKSNFTKYRLFWFCWYSSYSLSNKHLSLLKERLSNTYWYLLGLWCYLCHGWIRLRMRIVKFALRFFLVIQTFKVLLKVSFL